MTTFHGRGLATRREQAGLSQPQLAGTLGVTQQAVSDWELGRATPTATRLPALAFILRCTIDDLYHTPEEDTPQTGHPVPHTGAA
jgi:transcriptional regulator with XRE-family HTH domain